MTLEEFLSKYSKEGLDLDFKNNIPNWFNVQTKSQGSRNITIEAWNDVVRALGRLASGDNTSYEMLKDVISVLNDLRVKLDGKLDLKPFTNSDAGKFVAIGPDGSLTAVYPPSGGGGGGGIVIETDPTVPTWAKQPNKPTYTASEVGAASADALIALRNSAVGVPTYNTDTGVMTFKTLDGNTTKTIDLPVESILEGVELSEDGKTFIFTFRGDEPIRLELPAGNITLPTWVTDVESASGEQLLLPPNTEAVRNFIVSKLSEKLDKKPFTAAESGKNVTVGSDGSLVATDMPSGATGVTSNYKHEIHVTSDIENDLNVYCIVYSDSRNLLDDYYDLGSRVIGGYPCKGTAENGAAVVTSVSYNDFEYDDGELISEASFTFSGYYVGGGAFSTTYYVSDHNLSFHDISAEYSIENLEDKVLTNVSLSEYEDGDGNTSYLLNLHNLDGVAFKSVELPSFGGGGNSAIATLPLQYFRISSSNGYNVVKLSENLYGARLLLTSEGATCTYGVTREVWCRNWSVVPVQDFTVVVGDSPLHTDYTYDNWDYYNSEEIPGLAYMVNVTLDRSDGLLKISTRSRNFLSYFPEFDYYVELEINTAIRRAMVRVTQLKIY